MTEIHTSFVLSAMERHGMMNWYGMVWYGVTAYQTAEVQFD